MQSQTKTAIKKTSGGVLIGVANSLFGGGGGMLAVPLLGSWGLNQRQAHATAILLILPVCITSLALYFWNGYYDFSVLIPTAVGVAAGGFLGAKLLGKLPQKKVSLAFAFLQAFAGFWLLFGGGK